MKTTVLLLQAGTEKIYPESVYRQYEMQQMAQRQHVILLIVLIVFIAVTIYRSLAKKRNNKFMADVFPSIIAIVGGIALILAILIGIQLMFQKAANLSGRRHVIKVNGATLFDVRPERKYYPPPKQLSYNESPLSTYQSSFYKTRIFIYNPERKIIEIYYKH